MIIYPRRLTTVMLSATMLAGCAAGPDYRAPATSSLGIPATYDRVTNGALNEAALASWWSIFHDPVLDGLISHALDNNFDLAQAQARLVQAREAAVQAGAAYVPTVQASGSTGRNFTNARGDSNSFSVGAEASWEVDLFGRIGRSTEAARANMQAVHYDLATIRVAIIAELATNYLETRLAQEQLRIARDTLTSQDENLQIAHWRVIAGLASSLDEEQARTQRAQTAANIPTLEQRYRAALARIAVLTGQAPGEATRAIEIERPIPAVSNSIASGIPADTLRQRPDVRAAERTLAAETARIGVAKSALLPALRISGDIGTSALSMGRLGDVITGGLFASLGQLIFDGGATASRVRAQRAAADGALASYRQTVLTALEDVDIGLVAIRTTAERGEYSRVALEAATNSAIIARQQYRAGLTDFQTLLETERSLLASRTSEADSRANQALAMVQLYKALGGGWQGMSETVK